MKKFFQSFFTTIINIILFLNLIFMKPIFASNIIYMPTKPVEIKTNESNQKEEYYDEEYEGPNGISSPGEVSINNDFENIHLGVEVDENFVCVENNIFVTNGWRKINIYSFAYYGMPIDGFNHDYVWCYFNSKGNAVKASDGKFKKIKIDGNYYAFNEYGQMLEGFFDENGEMYIDEGDNYPYEILDSGNLYYANPETGILHTGWLEIDNNDSDRYKNDATLWMYFNTSNFKAVHATGEKYKTETINGKKYAFDNYGIMLTGFNAYDYNVEQGILNGTIKFFGKDGALASGFIKAVPSENMNEEDYEDEEENTYYVNNSGRVYKNMIKKIGNYYYGFDASGAMVTNLSIWKNGSHIATIDTEETYGKDFILYGNYITEKGEKRTFNKSNEVIHYFNKDGHRVTNPTQIEFADETYTYAASNSGAYDGLKDKKFYQNGLQMKPIDDKYGIYIMNIGNGIGNSTNVKYNMSQLAGNLNVYVINKNGNKVTSSSTQEDNEEKYWLVSSGGNLLNIYSVPVRKSGNNYQFKSEPANGKNETWINFGEADRYGRTCVVEYAANGTKLANGAKSYYQTKPSPNAALNFILN